MVSAKHVTTLPANMLGSEPYITGPYSLTKGSEEMRWFVISIPKTGDVSSPGYGITQSMIGASGFASREEAERYVREQTEPLTFTIVEADSALQAAMQIAGVKFGTP